MATAAEIFELVDTQQVDALVALYAVDAKFALGNNGVATGRGMIAAGNKAFFTLVQGIRHELLREWAVGNVTIAETDVTYTRRDGKEVKVPAVSIWEVDEAGLITDYRVFVDQGPVFAP